MIDLQPDSPVPIHEQLVTQLVNAIASGALKAGAVLAEYRAFAQQLLTNPQAVARAYADLEWQGILQKHPSGGMEITPGAERTCRFRLQDAARNDIRQAVRQALACGLSEADVHQAVELALAAPPVPLTPAQLDTAIKKSTHESRHRDSQNIQGVPPPPGRGQP